MKAREGELRLSLLGHLGELRSRLLRAGIAVIVLAGLSLTFSRELFHLLVLPILDALPEGQRTLVQTSAIEEINTFIKVGIYAGVFLSAPVILHQLWSFVAPGLYANERRMAVPFVAAGTACFVTGVVFCYFFVLPPAFEFLLQPEEMRARVTDLRLATGTVDDAARLLRVGDLTSADRMLDEAEEQLESLPASVGGRQAILARLERIAPLVDAAGGRVTAGGPGATALSNAILASHEARSLAIGGEIGKANDRMVVAERELGLAFALGVGGEEGTRTQAVVARQAASIAKLAAAGEQQTMDDWTRPMLSMREQLNLVLVLLLAFGLIFEIPVIFALLAALGIVDGSELSKVRRYAVVVIVLVAALITPTGDPFNLALMAVPMVLCYEIGTLAAKFIARRRKAREAAALAG